ncbi:hypothetical protein BDK51DRAFT_29204 [Blyttiomyces helicus]|uniref:TPX2 C-terminal domain-containing protein n=1 Tax=Blyttiomyces helicus TaxID=388810 RepID=A0A4P9W0H3_9FUNG|nr:hypothetical protein BDK51DRAFT_29204 [Blyttiomyces helicus]|eukprot:RKO84603.1 hypothetical protein BDK51DRAFT_29204 [Blyttiomyces helicus]
MIEEEDFQKIGRSYRAQTSTGNDVSEPPKSPFVSLVEKVKKFEDAVPDRFRTKPGPVSRLIPRMTQPKSPFLRTKMRTKSFKIPTTEEREEQMLAALEPFKAKPVDRKILESEAPIGVPKAKKLDITIPMSPALTKRRPAPPREPTPPPIIKANPIRHFAPFQPVIEHRLIQPDDFALPGEQISLHKMREFEDALRRKEEEERKARQFSAQPLPDDAPDPLPIPYERPLTNPQPFHLETEVRGLMYQLSLEEKIEREVKEEIAAKTFLANPMPLLEPFVPKRSDKPPTEVEPLTLYTDIRAEERRAYEESRKMREAMEEEERERMRLEEEEREKAEVKRLREQQVHHANPVRHYPGIVINPSHKKLTQPESPMIGNKRRTREMPKYGQQDD